MVGCSYSGTEALGSIGRGLVQLAKIILLPRIPNTWSSNKLTETHSKYKVICMKSERVQASKYMLIGQKIKLYFWSARV